MTKGKTGLFLPLIATLAFVCVFLDQSLALLLVVGFAVLAEKDKKLNSQVIQALLLSVCYNIITSVIYFVFGYIVKFFIWVEAYGAANVFGTVESVITEVLSVAVMVLSVIAVITIISGKELKLPILSTLAEGEFVKKKAPMQQMPYQQAPMQQTPYQQAPVQQAPYQQAPVQQTPYQQAPMQQTSYQQAPVQQAPYQQAPTQQAPMQQAAMANPTPAGRTCPNCGATIPQDDAFCQTCGTKIG